MQRHVRIWYDCLCKWWQDGYTSLWAEQEEQGVGWYGGCESDRMSNLTSLDTPKTAEMLNISPRTLERWRIEGRGPTYRKLGSRVIYLLDDLILWLDEQRRTSTTTLE